VNPIQIFEAERDENIRQLGSDADLQNLGLQFMRDTLPQKYVYNFTWLGRPFIQFPQDIIAFQEVFWHVQPDLVIETGVAHGGGVVFFASMFQLLGNAGRVLGVDIEIRPHNRKAIEEHPLAERIKLIEGSSTDPDIVKKVHTIAAQYERPLLVLDSDHCHAHVLQELECYASLVPTGSYVIVCDTTYEDHPEGSVSVRSLSKTDNPKTAVRKFLESSDRFEIDRAVDEKLLVTGSREGFLRRVR
jgi:cephalosporin hydroxylase